MDFNDYQKQARRTAFYHESYNMKDNQGILYTVLGLNGEAGEVAEILKKYLRDDTSLNALQDKMYHELGDVLWYLAMVADELDLSFNEIAEGNLEKLRDRQERGKLSGSGDQR